MRYIWLCVVLLLGGITTTFAQTDSAPPVIFTGVQDGQLRIFTYDPDADTLQHENVPTHPATEEFDDLSWSPDGLVLSFSQHINPHLEFEPMRDELIFAPYLPEHQPYLIETSLARNLQLLYPPQFDSGGYLTYVIRPPVDTIYEDDDLQGVVLDVYQRFYLPGQRPQLSGQIVHLFGCGHTPSTPMEALHDADGALKSAVQVTPFGIAFTPFCRGRGLALSSEESFILLNKNLNLIMFAPDQATVAGWDGNQNVVVQYDLATRTTIECSVDGQITQLAWALDGTHLYYSTQILAGNLEFTPAEADALNAIMTLSEYVTERYAVNLYAITPGTCDAQLLYSNPDAYAISRIQPQADYVLFSEIANGEAWFDQILADGARDFTREQSTRDIVALKLYYLPFEGETRVIGQGIEKVTVRP
jgi:hypothetical protein